MFYGPTVQLLVRGAASDVDRVVQGERPIVLPVQQAACLEPMITLKIARAVNLAIPPTLLDRADEVIE
jgi:putative ABC transport system substrate-binding protein